MELRKTSLSAGRIIRKLLLASQEVTARAKKIFPVVIDKAVLPYVLYRRAALEQDPTKAGFPGADTVQMEIYCYTEGYEEGVELAEAVRRALDFARDPGMRSCTLTGAEEFWEDDACVQRLVFTIKI